QPLDDFAADVSRGVFQRLDRVRLLFVRATSVNEHARMLHIRLDAHFADHHHAFQSWILELAREHSVDFVRDLFAHAFVTMIGRTHLHPLIRKHLLQRHNLPGYTISNFCPIRNEPRMRSASSSTFCSDSCTCFS